MREFRRSDLARTIAEVYQVQGETRVEECDVVLALHPMTAANA